MKYYLKQIHQSHKKIIKQHSSWENKQSKSTELANQKDNSDKEYILLDLIRKDLWSQEIKPVRQKQVSRIVEDN